jgi:hypothetical protein
MRFAIVLTGMKRFQYTSRAAESETSTQRFEEVAHEADGIVYVLTILPAWAQNEKATPTVKGILLAQLRSTHNQAEWFVPANTAVEDLTAEQASIIYVRKEQGSWNPKKGVK